LKELEENFSDTRAGLLKQMEENSKYIAELKGTIHENEVKLSNYADENKCLKVQLNRNRAFNLILLTYTFNYRINTWNYPKYWK